MQIEMEKYGVELSSAPELEKEAKKESDALCKRCGNFLKNSNPRICWECGSIGLE